MNDIQWKFVHEGNIPADVRLLLEFQYSRPEFFVGTYDAERKAFYLDADGDEVFLVFLDDEGALHRFAILDGEVEEVDDRPDLHATLGLYLANNGITSLPTGRIHSIAATEYAILINGVQVETIWSPPWNELDKEDESLMASVAWMVNRLELPKVKDVDACPQCGKWVDPAHLSTRNEGRMYHINCWFDKQGGIHASVPSKMKQEAKQPYFNAWCDLKKGALLSRTSLGISEVYGYTLTEMLEVIRSEHLYRTIKANLHLLPPEAKSAEWRASELQWEDGGPGCIFQLELLSCEKYDADM